MLNRIKQMLDRVAGEPAARPASHAHDELHIAACALLVEAATLDGDFTGDERAAIGTILRRHLGLSDEEAGTLLEEAEARHGEANQLLAFTRAIKNEYSPEERVEIIEMLWEVAYADGVLHDYEANLLRRIGGLIYVSDRERGAARRRVLTRLGIAED